MNMKASCEFVLLSVLFAFSWGKDIQKTRLQPGIPKQSVRIESIDVNSKKNFDSQRFISEDASCVDKSPYCGNWALRGECKKNPRYMEGNCCVWCNHIITLQNIKANSCSDDNSHCVHWANGNECCKNPAYMLENCCSACKAKG
ncbi:unnamed protein product, partial [Porites lobata]